MRSATAYLLSFSIFYLYVQQLEGVAGRSTTTLDGERSGATTTEIHLQAPPTGREHAILLVGQMSGQLIAFDAWTGEIINSIDSGGPLVANCRDEILQELQPDTDALQTLRQQARTDVALQSKAGQFDQHNFAPTMDGRLYHLSKRDNEWKEVLLPTSDLLQSKKPLRANANPELSNVLFVAEKQQRLYTFDADTGQMYPFFSADASSAVPPSSDPVLLGRVDITTKMLNLDDIHDFKCVTVSEYFVQFAATAQCETTKRVLSSPWITLEMGPEAHVVSLTGYDPDSRRILWKWNSHTDLTMVYGMLPKRGFKFYEWSVASPVAAADDGMMDDHSCPSPPPLGDSDLRHHHYHGTHHPTAAALTTLPHRDLLARKIDGQLYLLPTSSPSDVLGLVVDDNGTGKDEFGKDLVARRPSWSIKTVEIDGEKGVVLARHHVVGIALAVVVVVMLVACVFYRKGLIAKPEPSSSSPPSPVDVDARPPSSTSTPASSPKATLITPPTTPSMHAAAAALRSPHHGPESKSPLTRHKTGLEHLMRLVPAKMHRSLSFGGFSHATPHQEAAAPVPRKSNYLPELSLTPRVSDSSVHDQLSVASSSHSNPTTTGNKTQSTEPVTSTTTNGSDEFSKILPYICRGRFANEFEERSVLGKGGFGQVMLAENRLDGRQYAVKRIGLCLRNQTKPTLEKFLREVKILARLDHTYIVRYYQAWLEELGENDVVPALSQASYATLPTNGHPQQAATASSVFTTNRNILQHRSSDDSSEASHDSLFAPRPSLYSTYGGEDFDDDDDNGFMWDRGNDEDEDDDCDDDNIADEGKSRHPRRQPDQWSESDIVHESSIDTLSVRTQDNTRIDHWLYIQMQYCSEQSLADALLEQGRCGTISHRLEIFFQIASALEHVHSLGLIHRDLKPANIFVMDSNTIKLGDFGLSRYAGTPPSLDNTTAETAHEGPMSLGRQESIWSVDDEKTAGVGTYLYASPEQISGEMYSAKADMYSLGMILFELMQETPFGTMMERIITLRNLRDGVLPAGWLGDHVHVADMVLALVAKRPTARPAAHDVVTWCQTHLAKPPKATRHENVHALQVAPVAADNSTTCHNLLLAISDVIRALDIAADDAGGVAIEACGLKQHLTGQVLEFTLRVESNKMLAQVRAAIAATDGVARVDQLS
ncbi:Aste57867_19998 [Aphanomyces stellatus]|uniref:non-specific serine/threonine protein kinase n=1 Tax=Aphanomyces stellatus TaxID=120398 RepID=A0A485LF56_9STRA|nr:hypothetical protein As57867_019932 [Aphanomyces stellatus]VFT96695.1 Aste57867_19998 [Aphanomyces stellatus]